MHKPLEESCSAFPKKQNGRRPRIVRGLDRVAVAFISFACIYVGLLFTADLGRYLGLFGSWSICSIPLIVSVLLINVPGLTNEFWKLWLVAFAANSFGVMIMLLPLFNLVIHMHDV